MNEEKRKKILVVEDDSALNHAICYALRKEKYIVSSTHSVKQAKEVYKETAFHMILLDVNLPDGDGFTFCQWVKQQKDIPVLFLTARDLEEDALRGYEMGAEDYVTKPFSVKVLLKKIGLVLNRTTEDRNDIFDDGYLVIDFQNAKITAGGKECAVTPTEIRMLRQLVLHKGQLLTYEILLERLWDSGGQFVDKHALAVNVNRLRGKIETMEHKYISNVYGMGYQWIG